MQRKIQYENRHYANGVLPLTRNRSNKLLLYNKTFSAQNPHHNLLAEDETRIIHPKPIICKRARNNVPYKGDTMLNHLKGPLIICYRFYERTNCSNAQNQWHQEFTVKEDGHQHSHVMIVHLPMPSQKQKLILRQNQARKIHRKNSTKPRNYYPKSLKMNSASHYMVPNIRNNHTHYRAERS